MDSTYIQEENKANTKAYKIEYWVIGRVAYCTGLLIRRVRNGSRGSNPLSPAIHTRIGLTGEVATFGA